MLDGKVAEDEPKSERCKRTLPLDDDMVAGFAALQLLQREEAEKTGDAYGRCPDCAELHVVVDELGNPVHPESHSDSSRVQVRKAKLPTIRLHDTRHTCGTLMHLRGVPTAVISARLGHASASFTMRTYVHLQDDALRAAGGMLSGAVKPANEKAAACLHGGQSRTSGFSRKVITPPTIAEQPATMSTHRGDLHLCRCSRHRLRQVRLRTMNATTTVRNRRCPLKNLLTITSTTNITAVIAYSASAMARSSRGNRTASTRSR
jgi:hypothetical protein